jgi:superfamily I DNA/RNA helicase
MFNLIFNNMANMTFSKYQIAIFNEVENGCTNLAINAVAGSGKTTTIVECCKRLRMRKFDVKFLAFNKSIVEELNTKIGNVADVSTLHSFGYSILRKVNPKVKYFYGKYTTAIRDYVRDLDGQDNSNFVAIVNNTKKIFDLCRVNLITDSDVNAINEICDEHNIVPLGSEITIVRTMLKDCYTLDSNDPKIDYTDMIVLPLFYTNYIPKYKIVFIDECQDLNAAQRNLMLAAAANGRFIAVGDRNQAINGFAGADCESFDKIASIPATKELPLSVNYRCGRNMIALAKQIVPAIEAHDNAIDGVVTSVNEISLDLFQPNDMVLCRSAAPLVSMCLKLIKAGVTAIVKGKDIADGLISLIEKSKTKTIKGFETWAENEKSKLAKDIAKKDKITPAEATETGRYIAYCDRIDCILAVGEHTSNLDNVKQTLNNIFSDNNIKNAINLSTCHKSKGLESDRVVILLPNKLPLCWKGQKDWQYEQEMNLKYVALTRAKKELVFVDVELKDLLKVEFKK